MSAFSLPTQRCFQPDRTYAEEGQLFSAYAEVFPGLTTRSVLSAGLFSAYAEVFPYLCPAMSGMTAFLCLRRGVSTIYCFGENRI